MKLTLNLSPSASARDRYALLWALPATLIGAVVLVLFVRALRREVGEYRQVQGQVVEVQEHVDELRAREKSIRKRMDDPTYRGLLHRARFVNDLVDQRELSLAELSARLAGLMPDNARLTGLSLTTPKENIPGYFVRMGIAARGEDSIEAFLNDLEDSQDFKDVSIINQGFLEESSQAGQVNVICTARYLPGAE